MNSLQVIILALTLNQLFAMKIQRRIINGAYVKPLEFPWHVSLVNNVNFTICGGTILSQNWILSAAHCFYNTERIKIIFGAQKRNYWEEPNIVERISTEIRCHPDFERRDFHNDIALIKIDNPIKYNENIQPVNLIPRSKIHETFVGKEATVVGLGRYNDQELLGILNKATATIISNDECNVNYTKNVKIISKVEELFISKLHNATDNSVKNKEFSENRRVNAYNDAICTYQFDEYHGSVCNGDSGGELLTRDKENNGEFIQIGITSAAFPTHCADLPNRYTRISVYLDYIQNVTGITLK